MCGDSTTRSLESSEQRSPPRENGQTPPATCSLTLNDALGISKGLSSGSQYRHSFSALEQRGVFPTHLSVGSHGRCETMTLQKKANIFHIDLCNTRHIPWCVESCPRDKKFGNVRGLNAPWKVAMTPGPTLFTAALAAIFDSALKEINTILPESVTPSRVLWSEDTKPQELAIAQLEAAHLFFCFPPFSPTTSTFSVSATFGLNVFFWPSTNMSLDRQLATSRGNAKTLWQTHSNLWEFDIKEPNKEATGGDGGGLERSTCVRSEVHDRHREKKNVNHTELNRLNSKGAALPLCGVVSVWLASPRRALCRAQQLVLGR